MSLKKILKRTAMVGVIFGFATLINACQEELVIADENTDEWAESKEKN